MKSRVIEPTKIIEPKFKKGDKVRTLITRLSNYDDTSKEIRDPEEFPAGSIGEVFTSAIMGSRVLYCIRLSDEHLGSYEEYELALVGIDAEDDDDRPQCCKDHDVYGATCDTCDYGDGAEEDDDNKLCTYEAVQRQVTVEEVERLEEELRRAKSEVADLKNLIIKLLFDRYGY